MIRFVIFILISVSLFCSSIIYGQRKLSDEAGKKGDIEKQAYNAMQEGKFEKALLLYRNLLEINPQNPVLSFMVGYCYLNTDYGLEQAIEHLNNSINISSINSKESLPLEAYYYLAKAYHLNNQFNLALETLSELIVKIPKDDILFLERTINLKNWCENAIMLGQTSSFTEIENIFELNSKYSDINPLAFGDEREVIFTSRRENPVIRKKLEDDQFDENMYYTKYQEEDWIQAYGISKSLNSVKNESACWISDLGDTLIFRRIEKKKTNLYLSTKKQDAEWSVPVLFPKPINGRSHQTFASISPDRKYLFYTSDRKGGFGGTDIYIAENLGNNNWGKQKNLGNLINTSGNEESPVMHENGVLFFCSEGHTSMGGFDIYATYKDNSGNWVGPFNMGVPINSIEDDFFYQPSKSGQTSYTSSERTGTKGKSDIYRSRNADTTGNGFAIITGKIRFNYLSDADKTIEISFKDLTKNQFNHTFHTNKDGKFNLIIPAFREYQISAQYKTSVFYIAKLEISKSFSFLCMDQSINLPDINLEMDSNMQVKTSHVKDIKNEPVYTSVDKSTENLRSASMIALNHLISNDSLSVEEMNINDGIQKDSIYSIKIATSKSRISLSSFSIAENVKEYKDNKGNYIYYIGEFSYEWEALIQLRKIMEDYPEAYVFVNNFITKLSN